MNLDDVRPAAGVYVLLGSGGAYMYKGSARDLRKRVTDHMQGRVARTRNRRPLTLIYVEYFADYTAARIRENRLKSGQGRKWLKAWVAEWQTHRT
ncbi:MAG: GIY-YIG nuclease family protein [Kiritimatiellae bacterium]|nr:GIY-YIG nuclease family protein [Kiritimatiellia bacterium]